MADKGIGHILSTLFTSEFGENTYIIFTSDHGDHLGQHRMYQKMEMYEQAIRVPLIFYGPRILTQSVDQPVSHLDIMPTLLKLIDLEEPHNIDGISLVNSLKYGDEVQRRLVYSQYSGNPTIGDIRRAVISQQYKAIFDPSDSPELYDLDVDPLEMNNLANNVAFSEVLDQLRHSCQTWALNHSDWVKI
jgi:arylsulfatase A-like enzyme